MTTSKWMRWWTRIRRNRRAGTMIGYVQLRDSNYWPHGAAYKRMSADDAWSGGIALSHSWSRPLTAEDTMNRVCVECGSSTVIGRIGGDLLCEPCAVADQAVEIRAAAEVIMAQRGNQYTRGEVIEQLLGVYRSEAFRANVRAALETGEGTHEKR